MVIALNSLLSVVLFENLVSRNFVGSIQHVANDNGMTMSARPCFCKYAVSCEQVGHLLVVNQFVSSIYYEAEPHCGVLLAWTSTILM